MKGRNKRKIFYLATGMAFRDFRGFPSIQEVECKGDKVEPEVKLISLMMYTVPSNMVIASLNVVANNCLTHSEYASCVLDPLDSRRSRLKVLEHGLEAGERKVFGCEVNTVNARGKTNTTTWSLLVTRRREYTDNAY